MNEISKKIVIVDDEDDIRTFLVTLLEDQGYQVSAAANAKQGMSLIEQQRPDLICLDIMMPRQSGIALYGKLMQSREIKNTPTIFISSFCMARDFVGSGFRKLVPDINVPEPAAYLEKPMQVPRLLETIEKLIGPNQ